MRLCRRMGQPWEAVWAGVWSSTNCWQLLGRGQPRVREQNTNSARGKARVSSSHPVAFSLHIQRNWAGSSVGFIITCIHLELNTEQRKPPANPSSPQKLLANEELQQVKHHLCWQPLDRGKTLGNFSSISASICLKLGAKRKAVVSFLTATEMFDMFNSFQLTQELLW